MPPITPGSLSSRAAFTCPRPRSWVGLGHTDGEVDPDADGELAEVAVAVVCGSTVCVTVGDAVIVALPQPVARTAASPMPIRAEAWLSGRRIIDYPDRLVRPP